MSFLSLIEQTENIFFKHFAVVSYTQSLKGEFIFCLLLNDSCVADSRAIFRHDIRIF